MVVLDGVLLVEAAAQKVTGCNYGSTNDLNERVKGPEPVKTAVSWPQKDTRPTSLKVETNTYPEAVYVTVWCRETSIPRLVPVCCYLALHLAVLP